MKMYKGCHSNALSNLIDLWSPACEQGLGPKTFRGPFPYKPLCLPLQLSLGNMAHLNDTSTVPEAFAEENLGCSHEYLHEETHVGEGPPMWRVCKQSQLVTTKSWVPQGQGKGQVLP